MPQLDFSTYSSQIFWLFISFSIFLWGLIKVYIPRLERNISQRETRIQENLRQINTLKLKFEGLTNQYNLLLKTERQKAKEILVKTLQELELEKEQLFEQNTKDLANKLKKFESKIEGQKALLEKEMDATVQQNLPSILTKIMGQEAYKSHYSETDHAK